LDGFQAKRLQALENEMEVANAEYIQAVNRASEFASLMHLEADFTQGYRRSAFANVSVLAEDARGDEYGYCRAWIIVWLFAFLSFHFSTYGIFKYQSFSWIIPVYI
jgi:hypothetical protein